MLLIHDPACLFQPAPLTSVLFVLGLSVLQFEATTVNYKEKCYWKCASLKYADAFFPVLKICFTGNHGKGKILILP